MKGKDGLQLQQELATIDRRLPIIFISAESDPEARSQEIGRAHV